MIDLSHFTVFDFSEGAPYMSITSNGLTFNKSVIMKLDYPEYVRLLIEPESKRLVIQCFNKNDDKAAQFYRPKSNGVLSVRWNTKDLVSTISRLGEWDLKKNSYRVDGFILPEQSAMLFDLNNATVQV